MTIPFDLSKPQQRWFKKHTKPDVIPGSTFSWIQKGVLGGCEQLMHQFPPSCVVVGKIPLGVPGVGKLGVVANYTRDGKIVVRNAEPDNHGFMQDMGAMCDPEHITVVGYWKGLTPEKTQEIVSRYLN